MKTKTIKKYEVYIENPDVGDLLIGVIKKEAHEFIFDTTENSFYGFTLQQLKQVIQVMESLIEEEK